ncbi:MAG: dephospho-CoA kinase [Paracoccaceae bacterium]|jgi:dephospho-CoA kinase
MKTPFLIGLTGSIGMGKSTAAKFFAAHDDVAVWDADAAVHRLYAPCGAAVAPMETLCPEAIVNGAVDRNRLKDWIVQDRDALRKIEQIVHPLVAADRTAFIENATCPILVLDIPLLFETGADRGMDMSVVVSTNAAEQKRRVLARPNMTEAQFDAVLAKQMPDIEKRNMADAVIRSETLSGAQQQVDAILDDLRRQQDA